MKIPVLFLSILFLSSCATIVNTGYTKVNLYTKQDSVKVFLNDSTQYAYTPARLIVERSPEPLMVTLENQEQKRTVLIPSKLSPEFWFGNIVNGTLYFGYLVDLTNNKRFKYPSNVYYDLDYLNNANLKYKSAEKPQNVLRQTNQACQKKSLAGGKGTINIKLSVPEGNSFVINKQTHIGNSFGFLGLTTQVDYYYEDQNYFGIGAGTLTDFIIPVPAPYDVAGEYERTFGSYLDLLHGNDFRRFSVNYGLNISKYSYYKRFTGELFPEYIDTLIYSKVEKRIGLSLSTVYRFTNYFNVGIKYLPSFYTINPGDFRYGHFLFLDIAINFRINTKQGKVGY